MTFMSVGTVEQIWRYPVSSLGGETLTSAQLKPAGIPGDRTWCVVDADTQMPAAPERDPRWRPALFLKSRLRGALPEIGFPDGEWQSLDNDALARRLEEHFRFPVEVLRYSAGVQDKESDTRFAINHYEPSPVHLLTTGSLDHLANLMAAGHGDVRRFRPNILLRTEAKNEFVERLWIGRDLRVASTVFRATEETKRCGMTLIAQPGLPDDPDVLRTVVRHNKRNLGAYLTVETPGTVRVGDRASLMPQH